MRVKSETLGLLHLDSVEYLLNTRGAMVIKQIFNTLDIHSEKKLNDLIFSEYMLHITDLTRKKVYEVFDMLDIDGSGYLDFDEFYLLICILIAVKDGQEKQFIYRHSRTVFDLLDQDASNTVSAQELKQYGFLFNLEKSKAIDDVFKEYDISGDMELNYAEFRTFAMAAIDKQNEMEAEKKRKVEEELMKRQQMKELKQYKIQRKTILAKMKLEREARKERKKTKMSCFPLEEMKQNIEITDLIETGSGSSSIPAVARDKEAPQVIKMPATMELERYKSSISTIRIT